MQSERYRLYSYLSYVVIGSIVAAFLGLAFGYPSTFTPTKDYRTFSRVAHDGWIEDGATISLPRLYRRGNRVDISLKSWRPPGVAPAKLRFLLCGEEVSQVEVSKDLTHRIFLTGSCEPREIEIKVDNPFTPSAKDTRQLGAQIKIVSVSSKLGLPIVWPELALFVALFIVIPVATIGLLFSGHLRSLITIIALISAGFLVDSVHLSSLLKLLGPWFATTLLSVGAHLRFPSRAEGEEEGSAFITALLLLLILGFAAYLRFGHISFGLPMNFHPDEVPKFNAIMRMVSSGTLDPDYFLHPTLLLYSAYGMNTLLHGVGYFTGDFPSTIILAGRMVSALAGTLSVGLVFWIGSLLVSRSSGLIGAALLAVFPLHVTCSRYVKEDALLTFFVLLATLFVAYAIKHKNARWFLLAGVAAGCSASVKYSGFLTLGVLCLGGLYIEERFPREKKTYLYLIGGLILIPIVMLCCSPYIILNSTRFLIDFESERSHMSKGHYFAITGWSQYWSYHLVRSMLPGMTTIPWVLGLLSAGFFVKRKDAFGIFFLLLALGYYLPAEYVKAKPAPQPERYILPCLPFVALMIGVFIQRISSALKSSLVIAGCAIVLIIYPALRSYDLYSELVPDTRLKMMSWMDKNLPQGAKVYIDHKRYSPELPEARYNITYAPRSNIHRDLNLEVLKEQGQEYLLLSSLWYDRYFSQPKTDDQVRMKIVKLFEDVPIEKEFVSEGGTYGFHNPKVTLFRIQ